MKALALDTATEACSVALILDGAVHARFVDAPREHGERLFGLLDEVLAEAGAGLGDLDVLVLARGPGAFTGVRIAAGAVQGLALACDLPVIAVSTLTALAQGAWRVHGVTHCLPAIDARMGEVYWAPHAVDATGLAIACADECVARPAAVPSPGAGDWAGVGTGWEAHGVALLERVGGVRNLGRALPVARDLLPAAQRAWQQDEVLAPEAALPVYVRDRVATPARARGRG